MDVYIEREDCTMCAVCRQECPDFFQESPEDGLSQVVETYRVNGDGEAPDSMFGCINAAAQSCPLEIIQTEGL